MGEATRAGESTTFKLSMQCQEDSKRWFPESNNLIHHSLSLGGEVGEFQNLVKKIDRGSLSIKDANVRYQLMMELTDAYVYLLNIAGLMGLDLEQSYKHVRAENEKRFGNGR